MKLCQRTNTDITQEQIIQVQKHSIAQVSGKNLFKLREGRIGASQSKAAAHSDPALPSQSLIQGICYLELHKLNTKAVRHGCNHEASTIRALRNPWKKLVNFKIVKCGLFINQERPWIHATPDFLCSCDCCDDGCEEIKCSYCIENCDFDSYVSKPSSWTFLGSSLLDRNEYYYQVQQHLCSTKLNYNYFTVCAVNEAINYLKFVQTKILPDKEHWN